MISTKQQAFDQLENIKDGIPFDGIRYLYDHPQDLDIEKKIAFYLTNAYNPEVMVDPRTEYYSSAPLWYAIVAENHVSESLITLITGLFTSTIDGWDFLDEQGSFLVGKSCDVLGDRAVSSYLDTIEEQAQQNSEYPYLFLFDCLSFAKEDAYQDQVLRILENPEAQWLDGFVSHLGTSQFKGVLPRLRELLAYYQNKQNKRWLENQSVIELQAAIEQLETNEPRESGSSYYEQRVPWESHYAKVQHHFAATEVTPKKVKKKKEATRKIGRNDPCHCGSGKKYKKCCWPD